MLVGAMHDRASVNNAAMQIVSVMYPSMVDIGCTCISHTLAIVGDKFKTPMLHLFYTLWVSLFSHSSKVKALWKQDTGRAMSTYCHTRWWSWWEVMHQVFQQCGEVAPFLNRHTDISPATRTKLLNILNDAQQLLLLKIELAAVIDISSYFNKATYILEGDSLLVLKCYKELVNIRAVIQSRHYPNVRAVAQESVSGDAAAQQRIIDYAISCMQPGILYFQERFGDDTKHPVNIFKSARLFSPSKLNELRPIAADIDCLSIFQFLTGEIEHLKEELPVFVAKATDVDSSVDTCTAR